MRDQRDPLEIGNAIAATMQLQKCSVLEAADWVLNKMINESLAPHPAQAGIHGMPVKGSATRSPGTNADHWPGEGWPGQAL
jgi:hypothetical protein